MCPCELLTGFLGLRMHLQLVEGLYLFDPQHCLGWCIPGIPSLGSQREKDHKVRVILGYLLSSRPDEQPRDTFSKNSQQKTRLNSDPSLKKEIKGGSTLISSF